MGRYDGEDYAERPPCPPKEHNFAMNGICWKCNHSRDDLIRAAEATIKELS